ncbi:Proline--tRNA ligase [Actinidia chinensis var. chinensis]|uniref:Proline--tRNA ligase n=1 Tax=Actinidia chinensis var. chinensis TaxID=1590841 RepID=A0A2R6RWB7_ACTCC|nr:Proline--tRNA ligase [Actinidia chinensis var. chinensis]
MWALKLHSLTSIFASSSTTISSRSLSIFRRHHLPPWRLTAANFSAQSTAEKDVAPKTDDRVANQKPRVITPRSEDFNAWYLDVIADAELADYGPVPGTMVIPPYRYAIWEAIQDYLNVKFKETGHSNMYFPQSWLQFIPYSFIEKEASHVEGFSPELALVTIGGGKELEEKLVVRSTSETIVNHMFTQWIHSYRDLPLMVNQWADITRWEMRTKSSVRTLEFLWQEGHTAHATLEEAEKEIDAAELQALQIIDVYTKFAYEQAAIPVIAGRKSKVETFAGASKTYTIVAMMGDQKALQADDTSVVPYWCSYFVLKPEFCFLPRPPAQCPDWLKTFKYLVDRVVIVPIWKKDNERTGVLNAALSVKEVLKTAGIKVKVDDTDQRTPGWKFNFWEMKVCSRF